MSERMGITVSMPYSDFKRPICEPLMKPRSTKSTFITPRPAASTNVSTRGHSAGGLRVVAPQHPHADHDESFPHLVAMQEKYRLVAAPPAATVALRLGHFLLLLLTDRMIVLVEQEPYRALIILVVRHEQVRAVGDENPLLVVSLQFTVQRRHVAVVPILQFLRGRVAGQFAEIVLVARRLPRIEVAVVETLARQFKVRRSRDPPGVAPPPAPRRRSSRPNG